MYRMTSGPQPGIGTQLVQRSDGVGEYIGTSTYMMTPAGQAGIRGLTGCCRGGGLGCNCNDGLGIFDTGFTDFASWGAPEFMVAAVGAYILFSVLFTTKTAAREIHSRGTAAGRALAGRSGGTRKKK